MMGGNGLEQLYFPGCTLKTAAENFEITAMETAKVLGINLVEIEDWVCCGTVHSLTTDDLMHHLAPTRILIRAQEMGKQMGLRGEDGCLLFTLCSMCYNTLSQLNEFVKESPDKLEVINAFMDEEPDYEGKVKVLHLLELYKQIGVERIKEKVIAPLVGLKVAPYYGCLLLRPKKVSIDNLEDPTIMEDLIKALGAEPVDNPYKSKCCGTFHTVDKPYLVANLAYKILTYARRAGAEAIVLSCPLCAFNLENRQEDIKELYPDFQRMPVFYFTQLMAIAFGLGDLCRFETNYVDPLPLLKSKNIIKVKG